MVYSVMGAEGTIVKNLHSNKIFSTDVSYGLQQKYARHSGHNTI